jgi:hypothetical protein
MQLPLTKKILPFFLFVAAVATGHFTRPTAGHSSLSSLYDLNVQSWDEIHCLSPAQNEKLYQTLHLKPKLNPADCESPLDGRFNKILAFLAQNQLDIPVDGMGDLTELIRDPVTFISENVPELDFDFNQDDSIAYNAMQKSVYLGREFFQLDPYVSMGVLLHEAWHSIKTDPGHERCLSGDIAQTKGGCDEYFALSGNMVGGYSVTFAYLAAHGLYNKYISIEKRQLLINEALTLLSTRFNSGVQKYASVTETLVTLNKNHDVELVHPLLLKTKLVAARTAKMKPVKIDYNQRNGGVLILTEDQKLFEWSAYTPLQRFYAEDLTNDFKVVGAARLYLSADDYAYTSVLLADHRIFKFAPKGIGQEWTFTQALDLSKNPELDPVQIATYHIFSAGFLDKSGDIYRFGQASRGHVRPYIIDNTYTRYGIKFKYITGGVDTDSFWGVSFAGDVYYLVSNDMIKLVGTPAEPIKKVQSTILGVYLLTESGNVYFNAKANIGDREFKQIAIKDVQDIAIVKRLIPQERMFDEVSETSTACSGKLQTEDPYFPGFSWSLDAGRLYFGDEKVCSWVGDKVTGISFRHATTGDFSEFRALLQRTGATQELRTWAPFPFR